MAVDLLSIEPVKVSTDVSSYSMLVYGPPKIGKTTFIHDLYGDRVLHIMTEKRFKTLKGAQVQYIKNWNDYIKVTTQLRNPKIFERYDVVSIDTIENLYGFLEKYVAAKYKEGSVGERNDLWGADWNDLKTMWKDGLLKIEQAGFTPVFVSHSTTTVTQIPKSGIIDADAAELTSYSEVQSKKDGQTYLEFEKFVPDMKDKVMGPINKMVDNILFLTNTADTTGKERRVIQTRETLQWLAGSTFEGIKPTIPLDASAYTQAIKDAINLIDDSDLTDERQADTDVDADEEKLDYNDLMNDIKKIGVAINKSGNKERVTELSDEIFGLGNKMTDASTQQVELMSIAVDRLKELASELGVEYDKK